jgi:predicted anti-sigma-YlaC factor YlaD
MTEIVTSYMENDLKLGQRLSVQLHLLLCSACTRYYDQISRTITLLKTGPAPIVPQAQEDALVGLMASQPKPW